MQYVNCTPHSVTVIDWKTGKAVATYPPSGYVARLAEECSVIDEYGHPLIRHTDLVGMPKPQADTFYIVSRLAALAAIGREDIVFPFDEVRDEEGKIIGVYYLARAIG